MNAVALQLRRANSLGSVRQCLEQPEQSGQSPACPCPKDFHIHLIIYLLKNNNSKTSESDKRITVELLFRNVMHSSDCAVARCLSVCPFVRRLSVTCRIAGTVLKRLNMSSNAVHRRNASPF